VAVGGRGAGVFVGGPSVAVAVAVGVGVSGGTVGVGVSGGAGVSVGMGTMVPVAVNVGTKVFVAVGVEVGCDPKKPPKEQPRIIAIIIGMLSRTRIFLFIPVLQFKCRAYYNHLSPKMQILLHHQQRQTRGY
jgi:hypothetical protein